MKDNDLLFIVLKEILRAKKVRYHQIANALGLAESSVKRIFSSKNCSMEQFTQICELAGLSFFELLELANSRQLQSFELDSKTELWLANNIDAFFFYRQAVIHKNLAQVIKTLEIDRKVANKHLRNLEKIGLLELHPGDALHFPKRGVLRLQDKGVLQKTLFRRWVPSFIDEALHSTNEGFELKVFSSRVSSETRKGFLKEFSNLSQKLLKQSQLEVRAGRTNLQPLGVVFSVGPRRLGEQKTVLQT